MAAAAASLVVLLTGTFVAEAVLAHELSPGSFNAGRALEPAHLAVWIAEGER